MYPRFQQHQLFFYFDNNPFIKELKEKYLRELLMKTIDSSQFNYILDEIRKYPKFVYCSRGFYNGYRKKLEIYNKNRELENKKPKNVYIVYLDYMEPNDDKFGVVYEDTHYDIFSDFENEYLLKNFKYPPLNLPQNFSIKLWGENIKYIQEQFNTDKGITEIKAHKIIGITDDYWHLQYNNHYFFLLKECCDDVLKSTYINTEVDVDALNSMCTWKEWVENNYKLKPHQIEGIKFLKHAKKGCIFDETGIGKTFQSIGAAISDGAKKILLVTIANDKKKWESNFKWFGYSSTIIDGGETTKEYTLIKKWESEKKDISLESLVKKFKKNKNVFEKIQSIIESNETYNLEEYDDLILSSQKKGDVIHYRLNLVKETINPCYEEESDCTILNFDLLSMLEKNSILYQRKYDLIIVDECHRVKESNTQQSNVIKRFCEQIPRVYGLSATPIENNENIFNIFSNLNIIIPGLIPHKNLNYTESAGLFDAFIKRYCAGWELTKNGKRILIRGQRKDGELIINTNSHELANAIKSKYIRRTAEDVEGFPEKKVFPLYVTLDAKGMKEYDNIINGVRDDDKYEGGIESLVENIRLRQFMALRAIPTTVAFIKNVTDSGKKVLVGTHFKEEFDELKIALEKAKISHLYVNANTQKAFEKRDNFEIVDLFNDNHEYKVIFGNIETLGTAHNIPSANYCIVNSPDWANRNHVQIEGRAWRLNRKGTVYVVYPIFKDTIVEDVFNRAESKKSNFNILFP